ncbi:hypothetical protein F5884DRAFT_801566 [Xylogone sp. PMI_703]|nr:hypothetical protein F5884DRAFT_801566 [Xylogone sp. PMI_703]
MPSSSSIQQVEFINIAHPAQAGSSATLQRAYSHAARVSHARRKRQRIQSQSKELEDCRHTLRTSFDAHQGHQCLTRGHSPCLELSPPVSLLGASRIDPFTSYIVQLGPTEHFLFDHYVRVVIPHLNSPCNKLHDTAAFVKRMSKEWFQLALVDNTVFNWIFLASTRHLAIFFKSQQDVYIQKAIKYKLACLKALREAVQEETSSAACISSATIWKAVMLATDEIVTGDLVTTKHHVRGAAEMVERNGGPQTLRMKYVLWHLLFNHVDDVRGQCVDNLSELAPCDAVRYLSLFDALILYPWVFEPVLAA